MHRDYVIFYTEASLICILILLILLLTDMQYGTLQEKQLCFRRAIVAFILYFISDACWAAVLGGVMPRNRLTVVLFNLTNYVILSIMAYEWYMFMAASEHMEFRNIRKNRDLARLPIIVSVVGIVIAYIAKPHFWINENNELNSLYYPLMLVAPLFYLLIGFIQTVLNIRKTGKTEYLLFAIFPLGVVAVGMLQLMGLNAPTFCFGCTIMWLWFYIRNMQLMISTDALTGLNNRGQINRYMDQVHTKAYLMMIDIDHFKQINDTYGHAEGDHALILVAEALKSACGRFKAPTFLGRYGGDEFTVIVHNYGEDESPSRAYELLRGAVFEKWNENQLPYDLVISIGYDESDGEDMKASMIRADEMLYTEKRNHQRYMGNR